MALVMKISVDLSPWNAMNGRIARALETLRPVEIGPLDDAENLTKARASFDRGDETYPVSQEVLQLGAKGLAAALKEVATTVKTNVDRAMRELGKAALKDVKANIREGKVTGPERSDEWVSRKGHDINMIGLTRGSGKFVNSLKMRLGERS